MKFETVTTAVFKSAPEFFELEESGKKPNTVRRVDFLEAERLKMCEFIRIECGDESFTRSITNVCDATDALGLCIKPDHLVVISWNHPPKVVVHNTGKKDHACTFGKGMLGDVL